MKTIEIHSLILVLGKTELYNIDIISGRKKLQDIPKVRSKNFRQYLKRFNCFFF
jgi:hypothetical protein